MTVSLDQRPSLAQRRSEDFEFMVLCHAKGNTAMYDLLRDRSLDPPKAPSAGELEYRSWFPGSTQ